MPFDSICQARESTRIGSVVQGLAARALDLGDAGLARRVGHDLQPRHEMHELGEVGQHHRGVSPEIVLVAQLLQRRRDVARASPPRTGR